MSEPRHHHYVPEFLLAGFTPSASADDFLSVHDTTEPREPRKARPNTVGFQRDFYRLEEGNDPAAVERLLGRFESEAAPVVREIIRTWEVPTEDRLQALLEFVSFLVVRVPRHRRFLAKAAALFTRLYLDAATATPEQLMAQYEKVRASGVIDLPSVQQGQIDLVTRRFVDPVTGRFTLNQTWAVGQSLKHARLLLRYLMERRWGLVVAVGDAPNFVCCDSPVSLSPRGPPPEGVDIGWATPRTTAFVPLTKRIVLVGSFDEPAAPCLKVRNPQIIAELNAFTISNATRWVYSASDDFVWRQPDGRIGHASELRALVGRAGTQCVPEHAP